MFTENLKYVLNEDPFVNSSVTVEMYLGDRRPDSYCYLLGELYNNDATMHNILPSDVLAPGVHCSSFIESDHIVT